MIIKSLKLKNFRNYPYLELNFDSSTNIFYGDNAQGKTNILEAAYLSGTTKSHRGTKDKDLIRFEMDEAHIETIVEKNGIDFKIDMHLKKNHAKGIAINKIPIRKASELFGIINFVFFSPEDLNIIKNGPSERRRFIDMELSQIDKLYLNYLGNYNKILNQRNRLLKDMHKYAELDSTLSVWDEQLIKYGTFIIKRRKEFMEDLNKKVSEIHLNLTGGKEHLNLKYEPNTEEHIFESMLNKNRERDMRLGITNVGPHRDDICFSVRSEEKKEDPSIDIRKFGSQGQQRTAALSLKLSEIEMVKESIHDTPVLLLDDVLSELDFNRQNYLLDSIHNIQTLITCTGLDEFVNHRFEVNKVFHVVHGTVNKEN
jgi:DNA replication and repair protein RecF